MRKKLMIFFLLIVCAIFSCVKVSMSINVTSSDYNYQKCDNREFLDSRCSHFHTQAVSMRYTMCYVEQKILCHQNKFVIELYIGTFTHLI